MLHHASTVEDTQTQTKYQPPYTQQKVSWLYSYTEHFITRALVADSYTNSVKTKESSYSYILFAQSINTVLHTPVDIKRPFDVPRVRSAEGCILLSMRSVCPMMRAPLSVDAVAELLLLSQNCCWYFIVSKPILPCVLHCMVSVFFEAMCMFFKNVQECNSH